jgi:hypothetical protein
VENSGQINGHDAIPLRQREIFHRGHVLDPRVVDQNVHTLVLRFDFLKEGFNALNIAQIPTEIIINDKHSRQVYNIITYLCKCVVSASIYTRVVAYPEIKLTGTLNCFDISWQFDSISSAFPNPCTIRDAPWAAKDFAIPNPIPLVLPVIRASLPCIILREIESCLSNVQESKIIITTSQSQ